MLNEQTMKTIKLIAEEVYVYNKLSKNEARSILIDKLGMKNAVLLEDGTIFVIDAQGQDAYLEFPLTILDNQELKMSV